MRPIGCAANIAVRRSAYPADPSPANIAVTGGVSTAAGQTQFARIPWREYSTAVARVKLITPAFAALYAERPWSARTPETDAVFTMAPLPWASMGTSAALVATKVDVS